MAETDKLTDTKIRNAKPQEKAWKLFDGGGMYLLIKPNGSRLWQMAFRDKAGKGKTMSFGVYPEVGLKEARDRRNDARRLIRDDVNPIEAKREEKAALVGRKSFEDVTKDYLATLNKKGRSDKTTDRDDRLTGYMIKAFGWKPVDEITSQDLKKVLDRFEDDGKHETRMRVQQMAINIMAFARGDLLIKVNPFENVGFNARYTTPQETPRSAIIDAEPFGKLLRDINAYDGRNGNLVGIALKLLTMTFVRPGTLTNAEWSEFDLDAGMWTIPFDRLKQRTFRAGIRELAGKPHRVPLSRQAVALLRQLKELTGIQPAPWGKFLFPGKQASRSMTSGAMEVCLKSLGYKDVHSPHGFRSSASTMLNKERVKVGDHMVPRFAETIIEYQLEHVDASIAKVYDRDERLDERTEMMQFWSDKLDQMRDGIKPAPEGRKAPHLREVV